MMPSTKYVSICCNDFNMIVVILKCLYSPIFPTCSSRFKELTGRRCYQKGRPVLLSVELQIRTTCLNLSHIGKKGRYFKTRPCEMSPDQKSRQERILIPLIGIKSCSKIQICSYILVICNSSKIPYLCSTVLWIPKLDDIPIDKFRNIFIYKYIH